jgi:Tfp pilus assembly protein PilO
MKFFDSLKSKNVNTSFTISPMTKWILTVLILGFGVVLVVVLYAQEQSRNSDLKDEVNTASTTLVEKSLEKRALENKLAVANLTMATLATQFPSAKQSMDVEDALFNAAADSGLAITSINCPAPQAEKGNKSTFQTFGVTVSLAGDTEDFLRFVGRVGYWLPSASIESVSLDPESMTVSLQVYAGVGE